MDLSLIKELISEVELFSEVSNSNSVEDFRIWLNEKAYERENPKYVFEQNNIEVNDLENEICKQILLLSRFAKQMIRKGLNAFPQLANEEFTYLYRLMDYDSLTKMQLIEKNGHEKQTGSAIIKRLENHGFITEFDDENDKRSKRVKVSELGEKIFRQSSQDVTTIAKILSADLTLDEKNQLLPILKKLNEFHFTVYHEHKDSDIDEIENLID